MGSGREHWERVESLERLAQAGPGADPTPLFEAIADETACWHVKGAALGSLVALAAPGAGPAILRLLAREREATIRHAAIEALAALGETRALRLCERLAREDPADEVRAAAGRALALLRHEGA